MVSEKELERRRGIVRTEATAFIQKSKAISRLELTATISSFQEQLRDELAEYLLFELYEPRLGCASTKELIEELAARQDPWSDAAKGGLRQLTRNLNKAEQAYKTMDD